MQKIVKKTQVKKKIFGFLKPKFISEDLKIWIDIEVSFFKKKFPIIDPIDRQKMLNENKSAISYWALNAAGNTKTPYIILKSNGFLVIKKIEINPKK